MGRYIVFLHIIILSLISLIIYNIIGLDEEMVSHGQHLTSWKGKDWTEKSQEPAAQPNSRFCAPAEQCEFRFHNYFMIL